LAISCLFVIELLFVGFYVVEDVVFLVKDFFDLLLKVKNLLFPKSSKLINRLLQQIFLTGITPINSNKQITTLTQALTNVSSIQLRERLFNVLIPTHPTEL
jgi:hypothetical protein